MNLDISIPWMYYLLAFGGIAVFIILWLFLPRIRKTIETSEKNREQQDSNQELTGDNENNKDYT